MYNIHILLHILLDGFEHLELCIAEFKKIEPSNTRKIKLWSKTLTYVLHNNVYKKNI